MAWIRGSAINEGGGGGGGSLSYILSGTTPTYARATDRSVTLLTFTAENAGVLTIAGGTIQTNCSDNDGYIKVNVNDVTQYTKTLTTDTATTIVSSEMGISVNSGDIITFVLGWNSQHSSVYYTIQNMSLNVSAQGTGMTNINLSSSRNTFALGG